MHFKATHLGGSDGGGWRELRMEDGGFRGQEIRIRVINNFCSVMKPRERHRGGLSA